MQVAVAVSRSLIAVPSKKAPTTITIAISETSSAYSAAVAPTSLCVSSTNRSCTRERKSPPVTRT